ATSADGSFESVVDLRIDEIGHQIAANRRGYIRSATELAELAAGVVHQQIKTTRRPCGEVPAEVQRNRPAKFDSPRRRGYYPQIESTVIQGSCIGTRPCHQDIAATPEVQPGPDLDGG